MMIIPTNQHKTFSHVLASLIGAQETSLEITHHKFASSQARLIEKFLSDKQLNIDASYWYR